MNSFFASVVVDELIRTPWRPVGHCIPTASQTAYGAATPQSTPSPQVSITSHTQAAPSSMPHSTPPQVVESSGQVAANAAAAIGLSDLAKVPPPQRPMYLKYASHLSEGLCLIISDAKGNGLGFNALLGSGGGATGVKESYQYAASPSPAATSGPAPHSNQLATSAPLPQANASSSASPSLRAWVAQLRPEAMLLQLQTNFSHVKVGVPQLLRLVESSIKAGKVAVQFVPTVPKPGAGNYNTFDQPPSLLRVLLPVTVAVAKDSAITLSLRVDAYALDEVVTERDKVTCHADFVLQAIVQPMIRTQAALCAALTVLAQQGQLRVDEFEAAFRHPVVAQMASEANVCSVPTFWSIVTDAALPRPAPPPQPLVSAEVERTAMTASGAATPPTASTAGNYDSQQQLPSSVPVHASPTGGHNAVAGVKRVSSYVETTDERERKRALIEALNKKNQQQHLAPVVSPTTPTTAAVVPAPAAVAAPPPTAPTQTTQAQLKKIRKAMM